MNWLQLTVVTGPAHAEALSEALSDLGALSVAIEDAAAGTRRERPIFGEPGAPEEPLWEQCRLSALFPETASGSELVRLAAQAAGLDHVPSHETALVAEQDWVRLSQSQFEPIRISSRLWIVPSWREPVDPAAINLTLDPGVAFGTGSHPTTRLCLQWLESQVRRGETVLDYGCGSGILAIAAMRLGAGRAWGVDIDPQAVEAALRNALRNRVAAEFCLPEALPEVRADLTLANILANPLKLLAPLLARHTRPGGRLALAGILADQAEAVAASYRPWFEMSQCGREEDWVCLTGIRSAPPADP